MKTKSTFKRLIMKSLIAVFLLTLNSELSAQDLPTTELKDFKITIEMTEDGIKMQSPEGSAWTDLSFSLGNHVPQAIDEYGTTKIDKVSAYKDANLADYLFTITKTKDGIVLKGIEGTAWTELSFSLHKDRKQTINQFGMTE